jgi:Flp pilus assembly protein TadG
MAIADRPEPGSAPGGAFGRFRRDTRGAVFVEFLIAFMPVYVFFLCVIQIGLIFAVRLVTEHAALNGVRALAVVGGDEPKRYSNEKKNELIENGEREKAVRQAVILSMAPLILNGVVQSVTVIYAPANQPDGAPLTGTIKLDPMKEGSVSKVRLRVEADAACRLALVGQIACKSLTSYLDPTKKFSLFLPTLKVRAEAIFPYQGASYVYPP